MGLFPPGGDETEPTLCGHPTPSGPCTRKVLPSAGGCGYHPAPPDPPEERRPVAAPTCNCDRPLVLTQREGEPERCFWCSKALPDQTPTKETYVNGDEPMDVDRLIRRAAGREPPPEPQEPEEDAAIARQEALIAAAAVARGLTPERARVAARLADLDQLEAGKSAMRIVDELVTRLPGLRGEGTSMSMDEAIRAKAGRSPSPGQEPEERRTSMDGGVRQPPPSSGPSADSLLRAMARVPRGDVLETARNFDALRQTNWNQGGPDQ